MALSVGMTSVSTILAPFLTPFLTYVYAGARVDVNMASMFISILQVVIVPIAAGFVINHFFHTFTEAAVEVLPLVSTLAIVAIVAAVVSANSANLMTSGLLIVVVVILHNVLGYALGYVIGKVLKLDETKCRAISIEGGNAEFRSGYFPGHYSFCPVSVGHDSGCGIQRMAQCIRRNPGKLLCPPMWRLRENKPLRA